VNAVAHWGTALADWAIPEELLAAAPVSPFGFDPRLFDRAAERALATQTPSRRIALEALPQGGSVLDVGCGGGAASLSLALSVGLAVGVDEQGQMLDCFAERAKRLGIDHLVVQGRWPDVHPKVPATDLVVCHHVLYNVPDFEPFVAALTQHARLRVVLEMTTEHPMSWLAPLWQRLHGRRLPLRPTLSDATAALHELGLDVAVQRWRQPALWSGIDDELVSFVRRRLCLGPERDGEIRSALQDSGVPQVREVATLWWAGQAPG
jgi:precorrin-6B methylase 2